MKIALLILLIALPVFGGEPSIVFDNCPESGIPLEARAQERVSSKSHETLPDLVGDSIKTVRVRYFSQATWASEQQVKEYIAGLLTNKRTELFTFEIWSQSVTVPEIECLIDFKDDYRNRLLAENKPYFEGRLLVWGTAACFRDGTGKWWFVNLFDQYHRHHPLGNHSLSK